VTIEQPPGLVSRTAAAVRDGVLAAGSQLADWFASFVNGIKGLVPIVLLGCQAADVQSTMPDPPATVPVVEVAAAPRDAGPTPDSGPRALGQFTITFYYVIGEDEVAPKHLAAPAVAIVKAAPANDNQLGMAPVTASPAADGQAPAPADAAGNLAAITPPPDQVTLYTDECHAISDVSPEFASELALQGTGKLRDGRVLNISGHCRCGHSPCFNVTANQWGTAGTGRPLQPFRTVAVDPKVIKLGSLLYVPLLEGRTMPGRSPWGGYVHDGCVVADDTGGGIDGNQLDLFVGRKAYFLGLSGSEGSHSWARHVPVYDGAGICTRKGREVGRKAASI
jgi:3D (Asp-Asp-Asp) domain-containing protein